jgi:hypothetical protein
MAGQPEGLDGFVRPFWRCKLLAALGQANAR